MKRASEDRGEEISMTTKRFTMEADLASWVDEEAARLGMTSSVFVSTVLEWARDENFSGDDALFPGALDHSPLRPLDSTRLKANIS